MLLDDFVLEQNVEAFLSVFPQLEARKLVSIASRMKRLFENWQAKPSTRKALLSNIRQGDQACKFELTQREIEFLWGSKLWEQYPDQEELASAATKYFRKFIEEFVPSETRKELLLSPKDSQFRAWQERQIKRLESILNPEISAVAYKYPLCFELTKGCSVGCWFCGVSARSLSGTFLYTSQNRDLWRGILEVMQKFLGSAASACFLYHATDPFDNPDYEKFCEDAHGILGVFPQTTTAQALKDPSRTRDFLKLSLQKGQKHNRFSILSLQVLKQVHEKFSAEELAFTALEFQNKETEAEHQKVSSGRARQKYKKQHTSEDELWNDSDLSEGSITTVTGFLLNMVDSTVKLVSPCIADDHWTEGYRVHTERTFIDANHLKEILEEIRSTHMKAEVMSSDQVKFRRDLEHESTSEGFHVYTKFKTFKFSNAIYGKFLGEAICESDKTVEDLVAKLSTLKVPRKEVFKALNLLFRNGLLDDEYRFEQDYISNNH